MATIQRSPAIASPYSFKREVSQSIAMSLAKIRAAFWGEVGYWIGLISGLIAIAEKIYRYRGGVRRVTARLANFLLSPKLLGAVILTPSMYFGLPILNQFMSRPDILFTNGAAFMQSFLLIICGMMMGAQLLVVPSGRRR